MDKEFREQERELRSYLKQSKKFRVSVKQYTGLRAEYHSDTDEIIYILVYRKPKDQKLTSKRYRGLNLEEVVTGPYHTDRALLRKGRDPHEADKEARRKILEFEEQEKRQKITFKEVYLQWKAEEVKKISDNIDTETISGKNKIRRLKSEFGRFEKHVLKHLGTTPIYSINTYHLTEIFKPICSAELATAKKCETLLNKIFPWYEEKTKGEFKNPISSSFSENLRESRRIGAQRTRNFSAPDYKALPVIFSRLNSNSTTCTAIQFCILTACRGQAIRNLQWENVHLNEDSTGYFIIPNEDNKVKNAPKELRTVYFGSSVGALFAGIKDEQKGKAEFLKYVFPNKYRKDWTYNPRPLSENAINAFMRKIFHVNELKEGYLWKDADDEKDGLIQVHATSRACFQTWALEQKDPFTGLPRYSKELTEACLLHAKDDKYKGAYDRSRVSEEELYRIKGDWEDFVLSFINASLEIKANPLDMLALEELRECEAEIQRMEKQGHSIEAQEEKEIQRLEEILQKEAGIQRPETAKELRERQKAIRKSYHIIKIYRIYNQGFSYLSKAQDDFKKYRGEELLKELVEQKAKIKND